MHNAFSSAAYLTCVNDIACATKCVKAYMRRYVKTPESCERYARVHIGGGGYTNGIPSWKSYNALVFWEATKGCCANDGGC